MIAEKPHRLACEQEDGFIDRRLSDLLPVEFIRQIGLDPNQYLFDQFNFTNLFQRRMTDPGGFGLNLIYNPSLQSPIVKDDINGRRNTTINNNFDSNIKNSSNNNNNTLYNNYSNYNNCTNYNNYTNYNNICINSNNENSSENITNYSVNNDVCNNFGKNDLLWFSVELSNEIVNAFVSKSSNTFIQMASKNNTPECEGVVVIDGMMLRYGKILKRISTQSQDNNSSDNNNTSNNINEFNNNSSKNTSMNSYDISSSCDSIDNETTRRLGGLQIVSFDATGILEEYLSAQEQLAMTLIPKFIQRDKIKTELIGVETVSFQCRALLRVKVTNANAKNIESLTRSIISLFYTAVEIYAD